MINSRHSLPRIDTLFLLSAFVLLISTVSAHAASPCLQCHSDTWEAHYYRPYVHPPFAEQDCQSCHLAADNQNASASASASGLPRDIRWLYQSNSLDLAHWFLFEPEKAHNTVFVELWDTCRKKTIEQLSLPKLSTLPKATNLHGPPSILNPKVIEVRKGALTSATIWWETDTFTDAKVEYGQNSLTETSPPDTNLRKEHRIHLGGLKPYKTYTYRVISNDLFGNQAVSEPLTFTTEKTYIDLPPTIGSQRHTQCGTKGQYAFYRSGNRYLLTISVNTPVSVSIATIPEPEKSDSDTGRPEGVEGHPPLRTRAQTQTQACLECHTNASGASSHPINVPLKEGMTLPADSPLLTEGLVTCMSCHEFHSSDNHFRLLGGNRKELCTSCHQAY